MNSVFMRFGIGGALSGAAVYALGATNPVTLIALAALGQGAVWLPTGIRRCFHRPIAVNPAVVNSVEDIARRKLEEQDAAALAEAIELSKQTEFDIKYNQEFFEDTEEDCAHSELLGGSTKIPNGMVLLFGGKLCNAAVFFQMLLVQEGSELDSVTRQKIDDDTFAAATALAGINKDLFLLIWDQALQVYPNGGMTEDEATAARNNRRDLRAALFFNLLNSTNCSDEDLEKRNLFAQYYLIEQTDWWNSAKKFYEGFQKSHEFY